VHASGRRRGWLNVEQRTVTSKNRQCIIKGLKVFLPGHVDEVADHELGREVSVAARAVALRRAAEIQARAFEKISLKIKAGAIRILCESRRENQRRHAGVQVLANLQGNFNLFFEGCRNMLGQ
jgi:hypothetical protein